MGAHNSDSQYPVENWSAGVDWITSVFDDEQSTERALWRAQNWVEESVAAGNRRQGFGMAGFNGQSSGGCSYGRRGTSGLVQLSSHEASAKYGSILALGGRLSRLDLQVTCLTLPRAFDPAKEAYEAPPATHRRGRATTARTLIQNTHGGVTCYVGGATSEQRLRIYDKGAESESHAPGERWRWEVQLRRTRAGAYATQLDPGPSEQAAVARLVLHHLSRVGLKLPTISIGGLDTQPIPVTTQASNTLAWLEAGVRPSVERLLKYYPRHRLLEALGLAGSIEEAVTPPHYTES